MNTLGEHFDENGKLILRGFRSEAITLSNGRSAFACIRRLIVGKTSKVLLLCPQNFGAYAAATQPYWVLLGCGLPA